MATLGGSAALVSSVADADRLPATGGAGILALLASAVFRRDPRAAKRLADVLAARRRDGTPGGATR
ncbi:hypothetical protein [Actinoplanes sp. NPDC051494]|uniref:hypothetical protein n=1 Tax=Actinoplanes sp. NPDC051494 TaxID=3363907 RepID=UPI0037A0C101